MVVCLGPNAMMAPSRRSENGARNGSFLVLDVGNNTVRLGSASASPIPSQAFHPVAAVERAVDAIAVGDADTVSSSAEEGSASSSGNRKRVSKGREDPDWAPEKKVRRCSSWSSRTVRPKPGPPTEVSPGTLIGTNPPEVAPGGSPPEYLVRLLKLYYDWSVDFDQSLGEYVYICPAGLAHCTLLEAFESFLHGTSKYNEKAWASVGNLGPQIVAGNGRGKKGRRSSTVVEDVVVAPAGPPGGPLPLQQNPFHEKGKQSSEIPANPVDENAKSCVNDRCFDNEFNRMDCRRNSTTENVLGCDGETHQYGAAGVSGRPVPIDRETDTAGARGRTGDSTKDREDKRNRSFGVRRLRPIDRRNVLVDTEVDAGRGVENSPAARKDEGEPLIPERVLHGQTHCSMNGRYLSSKAKMLDCSSMLLLSQTKVKDMNPCRDALGVRRSMRINGKHVPVDDELDTRMSVDDDYSDWPEFTASRAANEDEVTQTTSFFRKDSMEGRMLSSDDANLKQANWENPYFHKLNGGSPVLGDSQLNQTKGKKSDCRIFNTQKHQESHIFLKNVKAKKPMAEKYSASVKETRAEIHVAAEAHSLPCAAKRKRTGCGNLNGKWKKRGNGGCGLKIRRNKKNDHHEESLTQTKLCILSWLIDSATLTENEKVVCVTKSNKSKVSSGLVTRGGIWCECCEEVMPFLKFQAHAGSNLHQPWESIFLLSGKTLMQCLREAWAKEKKRRKVGFQTVGSDPDPSDDTCGVCADGGHLICCDNCPSTFHQDCLVLKALPEGSWYCPYCRCAFCSVAWHGSDDVLETLTLLTCKQCGCKYHEECAWENGKEGMGEVSSLFCRENCKKIADRLSDMLGISYPIEGGFSWTLLKHYDEDEGVSSYERHSFITECNVKLSMALTVLNECFVPLIDQRTGVEMICQAVYNCGSNFHRLNYEGFYTLILEKDEEIISAASLRFHGTKLAEMPFIGTRPVFRRQGMCRRLLKAIEDVLSSLNIEKLVIPAISDLLDTWMTSFSFKRLEPSQKDEIRNLCMVIFPETTLLQKSICKTGATGPKGNTTSPEASGICFIADDTQAENGGDRGKDGPKAYELPSSLGEHIYSRDSAAGGQVWWGHVRSFNGQKDSTLEPCRMTRDSCFSTDSSTIPQRKVLKGSIPQFLPTHSTFMSRLDSMVPQSLTETAFSFPSVNFVQNSDPAGTEGVSASSSHMDKWFQSAGGAKDLRGDAIRSSLAFDSLLRISS